MQRTCSVQKKSADKGLDAVAKLLSKGRSILVVAHARPDSDAIGAMLALTYSARASGRTAKMLVPDAIPARYDFFFQKDKPAGPQQFEPLADQADVVAIVDTCAFAQLDGLEDAIKRRRGKIVVIDHHATCDDIGAARWIDTTASAAGLMVGELLDALGWTIDARIAELLIMAVTSDTGWFRFSNTDARTLRAVAGWLDKGVCIERVYEKLYQSDRPERLRLLQRLLESLELHVDGQLAVMTIRRADFEQTGARADETENLVNEALRLKSVEAVAMLSENEDFVRASLRSRGKVNVAAVAEEFGGGGHARAAGLRSQLKLGELKDKLIDAIGRRLRTADGN